MSLGAAITISSSTMTVPPTKPAMSVVVITPDTFATVRKIVAALRAQTVAFSLEIVFVAPDNPPDGLKPEDLAVFATWTSISTDELSSTARMRAVGVAAASATIVAFCEDHCFPAPEWAEALIERHREDWAGVGAIVENANPRSATSWSNLVIEYGDWLAPLPSGEVHHIGGHNSSYKRRLLLDYGSDLASRLEVESALQWDMAKAGHRFFIDRRARIYHTNMEFLGASIRSHFNGGRLFAARRCVDWKVGRRFAYFLGSPLIPVVRFVKCARSLRRTGRLSMLPKMIPSLGSLLIASGIGEMAGYGFGSGDSMEYLTGIEFRRERFLNHPNRPWGVDIGPPPQSQDSSIS